MNDIITEIGVMYFTVFRTIGLMYYGIGLVALECM